MNAVLASAESDPRAPASRLAWLRAALAWLVLDPPEGLSLNAISAVLGRPDVSRTQIDQAVSEALSRRARQGMARTCRKNDSAAPPLIRPASRAFEPARVFAGPGAAVLWAAGGEPDAAEQRRRPRLVGLVTAALVDICPALAEAGQGTILVDTNLGVDVPATQAGGLVGRAPGEGEGVRLRQRDGLSRRGHAAAFCRRSPGLALADRREVDSGNDGVTINFHRSGPATVLVGEDARLVQRIAGAPVALGELGRELDRPIDALEETLRRLEAAGIVRLDLAG